MPLRSRCSQSCTVIGGMPKVAVAPRGRWGGSPSRIGERRGENPPPPTTPPAAPGPEEPGPPPKRAPRAGSRVRGGGSPPTTGVVLVPAGDGEAGQVYRAAVLLALQHGPVVDHQRRQWLEALPPLAPEADEVDRVGVQGKVQRQGKAPRRAHRVGTHAVAAREALEGIEEQKGPLHLARQLGQAAYLQVPVRPLHEPNLADRVSRGDELV